VAPDYYRWMAPRGKCADSRDAVEKDATERKKTTGQIFIQHVSRAIRSMINGEDRGYSFNPNNEKTYSPYLIEFSSHRDGSFSQWVPSASLYESIPSVSFTWILCPSMCVRSFGMLRGSRNGLRP